MKFTYLPTIRSLLALNHKDTFSALEYVQAAARYDLAIPGSWFGFFGNLYVPDVRGQAFLAAHRYSEAAIEFQKIIDHPGIIAERSSSSIEEIRPGDVVWFSPGEKHWHGLRRLQP